MLSLLLFQRLWMVFLSFLWMIFGLCLEGQLVNVSQWNPYANVCHRALVALPGLLTTLLLSGNVWGCRPLLTFSNIFASLSLLLQSLAIYFKLQSWVLFGHLASMMFLHCGLSSLYLLTSVISPDTNYRYAEQNYTL